MSKYYDHMDPDFKNLHRYLLKFEKKHGWKSIVGAIVKYQRENKSNTKYAFNNPLK